VKRLLLVGGGHAHLEVLRRAALRPFRGAELVLVSPYGRHHYSSMVPGFLQGTYGERDFAFDLAALSRAAGARYVDAAAGRVDAAARTVDVEGEPLDFDAASLDVGSEPAGVRVPGMREHAYTVRPMHRTFALERRLAQLVAEPRPGALAACVAGGGAAGVEVALALHRRIVRAGLRADVLLVERDPVLLGEYAGPARRRIAGILAARGIRVVAGDAVARVGPADVALASGAVHRADVTVWLTGAAAPAMLTASNVVKDDRGFLLVDRTLRAVDGAPVWGAGDCVTLQEFPATPKAGVYAVREGPVLAANLRAATTGGAPREYVPQEHFLALLNTADGNAVLRWRFVVGHSRAAWWLKDFIDRRFVRRYQRLYDARSEAVPAASPRERRA
jgi:selenide,water dikinase